MVFFEELAVPTGVILRKVIKAVKFTSGDYNKHNKKKISEIIRSVRT